MGRCLSLMDRDQQEQKKFLEEQVEWCKHQDAILEKIEKNLYEMKEIAKYVRDHWLTSLEMDKLNDQLNTLKQEVKFLEQALHSDFH